MKMKNLPGVYLGERKNLWWAKLVGLITSMRDAAAAQALDNVVKFCFRV